MLSCSIWFSAPSFWMGGGLESRCVGLVCSADGVVRRLFICLVGWLVGWLDGCLVGWFVGWFVGCLVSWLVSYIRVKCVIVCIQYRT